MRIKSALALFAGSLLTNFVTMPAESHYEIPEAQAEQSIAPTATPIPSATPAPTSTPTPTPFQPRTVTINYSGDLLWHNTLWHSAETDGHNGEMDFYPQLAHLTDYVSNADVAICHSEVPFAPVGGPYTAYPIFAAPQQIAEALPKVGWDLCTTASNHAIDQGFDGLVRTVELHRKNGVLTSGTFTSPEERQTPVIFNTKSGVRVGVVSSTFSLNGLKLPSDKTWAVNLMADTDDLLAQAARARAAGADIVVMHMHAGNEYSSSPNQQQIDFAKTMTASPDVDLVIGQHTHVVQPLEVVNGKWVAYGAGNLMAQSNPAKPHTYDGYLATFTFTEQPDGTFVATAAEYAPTFITRGWRGNPARVYVISEALAAGVGPAEAMKTSAERTRKVATSLHPDGLTEH